MSSTTIQPEELLAEDAPFLDLTTHWLGIGHRAGTISFVSRVPGVLSGGATAESLLEAAGCELWSRLADGSPLVRGEPFLVAAGPAASLHRAWKATLSVLDHCSGIATRTAALVAAARKGNPSCGVFTTRKHVPGIKALAIQSILDGGALPHRLGLSETVLIFDQHKAFFPDRASLCAYVSANRASCCEKKLMVEVADLDEAKAYLEAGADGVQFDKVPPELLARYVAELRAGPFSDRVLIAAGGVNAENATAYAETGVNGLATSWPYDGRPLDMTAVIAPAD